MRPQERDGVDLLFVGAGPTSRSRSAGCPVGKDNFSLECFSTDTYLK